MTLLLAGWLGAASACAQQLTNTTPAVGLTALPSLIEEPPAGHVEVLLSGSQGSALDSDALAHFLPVLRTPAFLESSSLSTAEPLAPCALLSAMAVSSQLNFVFCGLGNPACFDLRVPKGTNILGRYDDDLSRSKGAIPRTDPTKTADIVARIFIWQSWGLSTGLNTLMRSQNQLQCLQMAIEPSRLVQALSKARAGLVMTHSAPVSSYITSVGRDRGDEWLNALTRPDMIDTPSRPTGNPLLPCEMLSAFRLAARVNGAWGQLLAGKFDTGGRPELSPYAEALKKPLAGAKADAMTAELLAATMSSEIARSNWLSTQLIRSATQGECLTEFFQPGGLRTRLERAGTTLPTR